MVLIQSMSTWTTKHQCFCIKCVTLTWGWNAGLCLSRGSIWSSPIRNFILNIVADISVLLDWILVFYLPWTSMGGVWVAHIWVVVGVITLNVRVTFFSLCRLIHSGFQSGPSCSASAATLSCVLPPQNDIIRPLCLAALNTSANSFDWSLLILLCSCVCF